MLCYCPDYQPNNEAPVSSSALPIKNGQVFSLSQGKMVDPPVPRALEIPEIHEISKLYAQGAKNALEAGKLSQHSAKASCACRMICILRAAALNDRRCIV